MYVWWHTAVLQIDPIKNSNCYCCMVALPLHQSARSITRTDDMIVMGYRSRGGVLVLYHLDLSTLCTQPVVSLHFVYVRHA
jgi:hypothetical protein